MNERQLTRIEVEAEHAEDRDTLIVVKELRKTRRALERYLRAHVRAINAVGTDDNQAAGRAFYQAYEAAWKALGLPPVDMAQLY